MNKMEATDFKYYKNIEDRILSHLNITQESYEFSRNDGVIIDKENKKLSIIEFKNRQMFSFKYSTHFIEVDKYKSLLKVAKTYKKKYKDYKISILYLNLFKDNKLYIYNLKKIYNMLKNNNEENNDIFIKETRYMNDVTASGSYRSGNKVKKDVYSLYRNKCSNIIDIELPF